MRIFVVIFALAALCLPASAQTISGTAEAVHPYAFELEGYEIYLFGVDSVGQGQSCQIDGRNWDCWAAAQRQLDILLYEGDVTCEPLMPPDEDRIVLAECAINGMDLGASFVQSGFGLAVPDETERYLDIEAEARAAGLGLWQSTFIPPDGWRSIPTHPKSDRPDYPPTVPAE